MVGIGYLRVFFIDMEIAKKNTIAKEELQCKIGVQKMKNKSLVRRVTLGIPHQPPPPPPPHPSSPLLKPPWRQNNMFIQLYTSECP